MRSSSPNRLTVSRQFELNDDAQSPSSARRRDERARVSGHGKMSIIQPDSTRTQTTTTTHSEYGGAIGDLGLGLGFSKASIWTDSAATWRREDTPESGEEAERLELLAIPTNVTMSHCNAETPKGKARPHSHFGDLHLQSQQSAVTISYDVERERDRERERMNMKQHVHAMWSRMSEKKGKGGGGGDGLVDVTLDAETGAALTALKNTYGLREMQGVSRSLQFGNDEDLSDSELLVQSL